MRRFDMLSEVMSAGREYTVSLKLNCMIKTRQKRSSSKFQ